MKVHLREAARRFADKLVSRGCVHPFSSDRVPAQSRCVTYSERRARSKWKLYQVRLSCVKGARISVSKDKLSIDVGGTVYLATTPNRKMIMQSQIILADWEFCCHVLI